MIGYDLARLRCLRWQLRVLVLLTVIILLALSPMIGAEAVNNILGYREQENAVRGAALATAELRNSELERVVNSIVTLLGNASRIPKLGAQTGPSCEGLDQLLINSPMRIVLAAADRAGRVVCSSVPIAHAVQISDRDFFKSTIKENTFITGGYVRSRLNDKAALVFGYPVRDDDTDEVVGTVLAYLDLDWLAVTLENARLLPGQKLTVTDQNGVVLADLPSDQGDRVGTAIPSRYLRMLKAPAPGVMDMDDPEGRSAIYAFIPITVSPANLYVLFSIRKEVAFATIDSAIWRSLALALLSIFLGIGSAWLVAAKYFKAPIVRLVLAAKRWGQGDYSQSAPTIGSGCIELKHLAEEFNRMATGITVRDNQLKASNRVKELTLATAGHDLRQPIQVLSSVLSLFSRKQLSDRERQYVDAAQSSIGKLVDGLDALVDTVRFHREALEGRYESFPVELVLQDLAGQWSSKATEKGLYLRVRHCNAIIKSNRKMLRTILQNLVGNAIKYTEAGGILVACRRRRDYLWIEVYDTGVGIPENKLGIIFRDFQQLDPAREGYGLGLWITRNTAEALGHELHVRSVVGKGSCFQVIVPLAHVASVTDSSADELDTVRAETPELAV